MRELSSMESGEGVATGMGRGEGMPGSRRSPAHAAGASTPPDANSPRGHPLATHGQAGRAGRKFAPRWCSRQSAAGNNAGGRGAQVGDGGRARDGRATAAAPAATPQPLPLTCSADDTRTPLASPKWMPAQASKPVPTASSRRTRPLKTRVLVCHGGRRRPARQSVIVCGVPGADSSSTSAAFCAPRKHASSPVSSGDRASSGSASAAFSSFLTVNSVLIVDQRASMNATRREAQVPSVDWLLLPPARHSNRRHSNRRDGILLQAIKRTLPPSPACSACMYDIVVNDESSMDEVSRLGDHPFDASSFNVALKGHHAARSTPQMHQIGIPYTLRIGDGEGSRGSGARL